MSIGLAIYGVDDVSPVAVFEMAQRFFEKLNYPVTAAAFHKRIAPQRTADAESLDLVGFQRVTGVLVIAKRRMKPGFAYPPVFSLASFTS